MSFAESHDALPLTQADIAFIDPDDTSQRQSNQ
jgi:hypothetical protein